MDRRNIRERERLTGNPASHAIIKQSKLDLYWKRQELLPLLLFKLWTTWPKVKVNQKFIGTFVNYDEHVL